jgi:UPF0716 protein FxsA
MPLFLLFVAVPILEIALFIQVGGLIGLWPTLAIVVLTAFAGIALVRTQGLQALRALQTNLSQGRDPVSPIAHGALILVAGVLLLTPGFFTDAVGLALLVPPVRAALIRWGASRMTVIIAGRVTPDRAGPGPAGASPGDTVEAEYEVIGEPPRRGEDGNSKWTRPPT